MIFFLVNFYTQIGRKQRTDQYWTVSSEILAVFFLIYLYLHVWHTKYDIPERILIIRITKYIFFSYMKFQWFTTCSEVHMFDKIRVNAWSCCFYFIVWDHLTTTITLSVIWFFNTYCIIVVVVCPKVRSHLYSLKSALHLCQQWKNRYLVYPHKETQ